MKYNKEYIQDLLDKFMEGQTTENEELILSEFFATTEDIPTEWMPYKEMFQSFKTDAYDFSEAELNEVLQPEPEKKPRIISLWPWLSAACIAAVVVLFVFHPWSNNAVPEQPTIAQVKPKVAVKKKDIIAKQPATLAETQVPVKKHKKANKQRRKKQTHEQEISTAELLETIDVLADIGSEDEKITVSRTNKGFVVRTASKSGQSGSYLLRRCSNSTSIELTNQSINF